MKRRVMLLCFQISVQFNNLRAANINKLNLPPILNVVSGDAARAAYIRSCQVKTCAIGPDLKLHNSNYMSHFLYSQNPFLTPTWVHKTGVH